MDLPKQVYCAPSILAADFSNIKGAVDCIHAAQADFIHLDVMDGRFVPNLTFGPKMVKDIRRHTKLPLDVHLMIETPENTFAAYAEAGADYITFHIEAVIHAHSLVEQIKKKNVKAGISIVPSTPVSVITELLPFVDLILIMSVNPGFGGQKLIPQCLDKVKTLSTLKQTHRYSYLISVDGGVNRDTAEAVRKSGADILVAGSAFFSSKFPADELLFLRGHKPV